jgi:hypothetical protein
MIPQPQRHPSGEDPGLPGERHPARPPWLPEDLAHEATIGSADLLEPEGMVGASCAPSVLALVRSAIAASMAGADAASWRRALEDHSVHPAHEVEAERCMRASGLWPWNVSDRNPATRQP